jgi:acetyl esterase
VFCSDERLTRLACVRKRNSSTTSGNAVRSVWHFPLSKLPNPFVRLGRPIVAQHCPSKVAQVMKPLIPIGQQFDVAVEDFEYQRPDGIPLLARMYQPVGSAASASVLDVHGGAWVAGDRTTQQALDQAIASSGVLVVAIDFRMPPEFPHPWQIRDANFGIRWLKKHALDLGAAPNSKTGIFGGSSGGHVAILSALRPRHSEYTTVRLEDGDDIDAGLDFLVADAPVTHPHNRYVRFVQDGRVDQVERHRQYWRTEEQSVDASPNLILQRAERVDMPPMLITQGTDDQSVPLDMTREFVDLYRRAGGDVEFLTFNGLGHGFILQDPARAESIQQAEAAIAFIRKHTSQR